MTTPTTSERLTALESETFRNRVKLDDISTDVRALNHQVQTEIVPRLDAIDGRLAGLERGQADLQRGQADLQRGVAALLAHFGITPEA